MPANKNNKERLEATEKVTEEKEVINNLVTEVVVEEKESLELKKLKLEIAKIEADKLKAEFDQEKTKLETAELQKPFYKKQAFLQAAAITFCTILISALGLAATTYFGLKHLELGMANADKSKVVEEKKELEVQVKAASDRLKDLEARKKELEVENSGVLEERDKFREEVTELDKQTKQLRLGIEALNSQKETLLAQKELNRSQLEKFRDEQANLISEIAKQEKNLGKLENDIRQAENNAITAGVDAFFSLFLSDYEKEQPGYDGYYRVKTGYNAIIKQYTENSELRNRYDSYILEKIADDNENNSPKRIRATVLMYQLDRSAKNKSRVEEIIHKETHQVISFGGSNAEKIKKLRDIHDEAKTVYLNDKDEIRNIFLDAVYDKTKNLSDREVNIYNMVFFRQAVGDFLHHPIVFHFLESAIRLINSNSKEDQKKGLETISIFAERFTLNAFLVKLTELNRINQEDVNAFFPAGNFDLSELRVLLNKPENKCLIDYWTTVEGRKILKSDLNILRKVIIRGRCN